MTIFVWNEFFYDRVISPYPRWKGDVIGRSPVWTFVPLDSEKGIDQAQGLDGVHHSKYQPICVERCFSIQEQQIGHRYIIAVVKLRCDLFDFLVGSIHDRVANSVVEVGTVDSDIIISKVNVGYVNGANAL